MLLGPTNVWCSRRHRFRSVPVIRIELTMNSTNAKRIVDRFPVLFQSDQIDLSPWGGPAPRRDFSFQCGDGWTELLCCLCEALAQYARLTGILLVATDVKEKHGTLRFYVDGADDEVDRLIDKAELESALTCQACGQWRGGSVVGLCTACSEAALR